MDHIGICGQVPPNLCAHEGDIDCIGPRSLSDQVPAYEEAESLLRLMQSFRVASAISLQLGPPSSPVINIWQTPTDGRQAQQLRRKRSIQA